MFFLLRRVLFGFFKGGEAPVGCRRLPPIQLRIPTKILIPTHRFCYRAVRVFGSVVHGENRPDSDVDFLVDLESGRTIFDLAGFLGDLRDLLGTEVDVVESRSIHPYIRDRVLAEAVGL